MTIEIPAALQWVSYLVGSQWPQGDEDAMYRIGEAWHTAAQDIAVLVPDLDVARKRTMTALHGLTADVAQDEFAMLFDGDASVEALAEAMAALGDLAEQTGKNIEYTKLRILTSLAIAAAEIAWALAQTSVTAGASAAQIPIIQGCTAAAIRQAVAMLLRDIVSGLGSALRKTMVHRIVKKSGVETTEAVGQELFIQSIQRANGRQDTFDWNKVGRVASANAAGGAAQGTVSDVGRRLLGDSTLKGAVVGYGAGMAKYATGAMATGQPVDTVAMLGAASTAATGAVRGRAAARNDTARTPGPDDDGQGA
ncbi:hypothetical protein H7J88_26800 [Mycolicibacterium flavescens]|uniref:Outer membrane channel protein CpnT-like N-terminal domain-containing protein n=1 Tax=Mycolicibacterium flavescens TaxID=1776 RepID=A0A1E3RPP1_MYCFV|nr:hypothetical protein [Mycolicibacterium flavescens]MCV7283251.1 hypothetical protein [Mycolicibacterium flavescens]ODQ91829.1 hypothetical protein BHQ18_02925 [Mycolicibacterium flavescens]